MAQEPRHLASEADIGSGDKTPGQKEIEKDIRSVNEATPAGRLLQSGTHLARILAHRLPDDTYEAQVFVRLTREPELAETYIPAGTYATETEAWAAAEERAKRAFRENEF